MARNLIRLYLSTYVDVELDENDFVSEKEMKEYAIKNFSEYTTPEDIYENLCSDPIDIDVFVEEEL